MNCVLHHHQRYHRSYEDRENQPTRDALVSISQLPNVRGKARRCGEWARGCSSSDVEPRYSRRSHHQLENSIRVAAFHAADIITGISGSDYRKRSRGQTGIAASRKWG
jgi:hypothetical protein